MSAGGETSRRRRRSPEEAEREILDAASEFLETRPFRELTIEHLMELTGLSRPSFYVYFRDRHDIIVKLVERVGAELYAMVDSWLDGSGDPIEELRKSLQGVVGFYSQHGLLMRAIVDAGGSDPGIEELYRGLMQMFVEASVNRMEKDSDLIDVQDRDRTAFALVWMTERAATFAYGYGAPHPERDEWVEPLVAIWARSVYGRTPAPTG